MFVNSSCGQLILRKITKIGFTRCQILLKCIKFDFHCRGWMRSPDSLAVFKGLLLRGGRRRDGKGRGGKVKEI